MIGYSTCHVTTPGAATQWLATFHLPPRSLRLHIQTCVHYRNRPAHSYYADQANINVVIENWIREKEERESSDYAASEDPSRASWEQAIDYITQQLQRNRASQGSEETSSSEESEDSEQDRASGGEQEKWQEEDEEKVNFEEERLKSHSPCHKEEKEELDGGGDRCRQEEQRRRNKRDSGAEPEGNMDEPLHKCFKASEDMQ